MHWVIHVDKELDTYVQSPVTVLNDRIKILYRYIK